MSAKAIFLDRDGVLNELVWYESTQEWESPRTVADLRIASDVVEPLRNANAAGWLLFVVTNQPSYAKGKTSKEALLEVQSRVLASLREAGVEISDAFLCLHHPDSIVPELRVTCTCRKPEPYFLFEAARHFDIDLVRSWMIGDQDSDLACARAAGCRAALLECAASQNKRGSVVPDLRASNLAQLIRAIEESDDVFAADTDDQAVR